MKSANASPTPTDTYAERMPADPPTGVRYYVLAMLCILAMITYLDRAMYGSAKDDMMHAVGKDPALFFYLLTAFQVAYALFEIPAGWLGDTYGPKRTLLRIVIWWSVCIALTGMAGRSIPGMQELGIGFTVLVLIQFFFGMGEAGAFPNITKSLYNWFPATERGFAQGAIWLSARFAGGLTPLVWVLLVRPEFLGLDWRQALWLFAGLAAAWCLLFAYWFTNKPEEHSWVNAAEQDLCRVGKYATDDGGHAGVPWGKLFSARNLWCLCGMYFCMNFGWYFLMYFLPGFMKQNFLTPGEGWTKIVLVALLTGGPLLLGMPGCLIGGVLTDRYVKRTGDRTWGRRLYGMIGFGLCAMLYVLAILSVGNLWLFALCIAMVGFCNDLTMGSAWSTCQDIGRRYAAIVSGAMNMIGNLGGALTNFVTGSVIKYYKEAGQEETGYIVCLSAYAFVYALGVFLWYKIDAAKPLIPDPPADHDSSQGS